MKFIGRWKKRILAFTDPPVPDTMRRIDPLWRPPMKFLPFLLSALIFAPTSFAEELDNPWPNREKVEKEMQEIYYSLAEGALPVVINETQYFQGDCITFYSSAKNPVNFTAVVALSGDAEGKYGITYSLGSGGKTPSYTLEDLESLQKRFQPKTRSYQVIESERNGKYVEFLIAEATPTFPKIVAFLSVNKNDSTALSFVAPLMGYYCNLKKVQ